MNLTYGETVGMDSVLFAQTSIGPAFLPSRARVKRSAMRKRRRSGTVAMRPAEDSHAVWAGLCRRQPEEDAAGCPLGRSLWGIKNLFRAQFLGGTRLQGWGSHSLPVRSQWLGWPFLACQDTVVQGKPTFLRSHPFLSLNPYPVKSPDNFQTKRQLQGTPYFVPWDPNLRS